MRLIIDRTIWLRGEGVSKSKLLRKLDQKMCCVGMLLEQAGVPRDKLENRNDALSCMSSVPDELSWLMTTNHALYKTNDDVCMPEPAREQTLTDQFKQHDIQVEFVR